MNSTIKVTVLENFSKLHSCLLKLEESINNTDSNLPAWFNPPAEMQISNLPCRKQVAYFLNQLEYLDDQAPKEIIVGAGILAASNKTIQLIDEVNLAKDNFKLSMLNLKQTSPKHIEFINNELNDFLNRPKESLKKMGLSRLHLKQCYRKIPTVIQRPAKVSWTWANTRSIKKITPLQAEQMLLKIKRTNHDIQVQLSKLLSLPAHEKLAIVQELAPHLRANITMEDSDGVRRFMLKGAVPIFYLAEDNQPLPYFTPPKEKQGKDKQRLIRSDTKLEPDPFLPSIRAHRYN